MRVLLKLIAILFVCSTRPLFSLESMDNGVKQQPDQRSDPQADQNALLQIKDWMAIGSGCRGRASGIGDVRLQLQKHPQNSTSYEIIFTMGSFALQGAIPIEGARPSFARECSLRLAAFPAADYRIKDFKLAAGFLINKDKDAEALLSVRLMTGAGTLRWWEKKFSKDLTVQNERVQLTLEPNIEGKVQMSEIACGAAKILGADISFSNQRSSFIPQVSMRHDESNRVLMTILIERCVYR